MKELSRLGHTLEFGDDFCEAWERLAEGNPPKVEILEAYEKLFRLGYVIPGAILPDNPYRYRITEKGKR